MWQIYEHKKVVKQIDSFPIDVQKRYQKWKDIVSMSGPQGLRLIAGFRDEALVGQWDGFRSSRLNIQYRIIYKVVGDEFYVKVIRVSAHDYRRK